MALTSKESQLNILSKHQHPSTPFSHGTLLNPLSLYSSPSPPSYIQPPGNISILTINGLKYGKYEKVYHSAFMEWWKQIPVGMIIYNGKINEKFHHPHWDGDRTRGDLWDQFDQLAELHTGKPVLQCHTCQSIIQHGIHHNNGTSGMKKHLNSKDCKGKQSPDSRQSIITVSMTPSLVTVFSNSFSGKHTTREKGLTPRYQAILLWSLQRLMTILPSRFSRHLLPWIYPSEPLNAPNSSIFFALLIQSSIFLGEQSSESCWIANFQAVQDKLLSGCPPQGKISLALDAWTSPNHLPFRGVVGSYITSQWKQKEVLLGFEPLSGVHSGSSFAEIILRILQTC